MIDNDAPDPAMETVTALIERWRLIADQPRDELHPGTTGRGHFDRFLALLDAIVAAIIHDPIGAADYLQGASDELEIRTLRRIAGAERVSDAAYHRLLHFAYALRDAAIDDPQGTARDLRADYPQARRELLAALDTNQGA